MKNNHKKLIQSSVVSLLIIILAFSRLIPHMPNFSPLGAICLFGAANFHRKWQAVFVPIFATWISDLYLNNYVYNQGQEDFIWFYQGFYWQYISYVIIALLGMILFKNKINSSKILGGAIGAGLLFFFISNLGVWVIGEMYPKSFFGLINCYIAGLPFIKGTLIGNLFYTPIMFYSYFMLQDKFPLLSLNKKEYLLKQNELLKKKLIVK